jgi:hypothetical protein
MSTDHQEQAISLLPLDSDVDLSAACETDRVFVFPFPRHVVDHLADTAFRFGQISLQPDQTHMYALVTSVFVANLFACKGFVDILEAAYVDVSQRSAVVFYLLLKEGKSLNDVEISAQHLCFGNSVALQLDEDLPQQTATASANPASKKAAKRPRATSGSTSEHAAQLRQARVELLRSQVPAYHLALLPPFLRISNWGRLLTDSADLEFAVVQYVLSFVAAAGHKVIGFRVVEAQAQQPQQQAVVGLAQPVDSEDGMDVSLSDAEDGEDAPVQPQQQQAVAQPSNVAGRRVVLRYVRSEDVSPHFDFDDSDVREVEFSPALSQVFSACNTNDFIKDLLRSEHGGPERLTWGTFSKLETPSADLPMLLHRCLLEQTDLYSEYFNFASRARYEERNSHIANRTGDFALLDGFFAQKNITTPEERQNAARLAFDMSVRRNGFVPKAWQDNIRVFLDYIKSNDGKIPSWSRDTVVQYRNLSYSGNYVVSMLDLFEQLGTYNFHVEQFMIYVQASSVMKRPKKNVGDQQPGMAIHMLNFGPPGVGKSNATELFLDILNTFCKRNSYSSLRSMYTNLPSSDYANGKLVVHDEAPPWVTDLSQVRNGNNDEFVQQQKEKLSSGRMTGERYVSIDAGKSGPMTSKTLIFNVDVPNCPTLMNTNAQEKAGDKTLYDRFVPRYMLFDTRAVAHLMQKGARIDVDDLKKMVQQRMTVDMTMLMLAAELQSIGVLSSPNTKAFYAFFDNFLSELKQNPFLDEPPFDAGSRRSQIIELVFVIITMHAAIHALFLDANAPYANHPFDVSMLLHLEGLMATGDLQNAILAICFYSHHFRSPTEYRCAQMIAASIKSSAELERQSRRLQRLQQQQQQQQIGHGFHPAGPQAAAAAAAVQAPAQADGGNDDTAPITWRTQLADADRALERLSNRQKQILFGSLEADTNSRYTYVTSLDLPDQKQWEICKALAAVLPKTSGAVELMEDHTIRRLQILNNTKVRCGPLQNLQILYFATDRVSRSVDVYALTAWLEDTLETHQYSVFGMLKRAALAGRYTPPGTYVTLEPLHLDKHAESLASVPAHITAHHKRQPNGVVVPNMLPSFDVPLHAADCPAWEDLPFTLDYMPPAYVDELHGSTQCTCFRSTGKLTSCDGQMVNLDPHTLARSSLQKTKKNEHVKLRNLPRPQGALYPRDALSRVFDNAGSANNVLRQPTAEEIAERDAMLAMDDDDDFWAK